MTATLPLHEIDALARGLHADPFAVLGPHDVDGGVVIRVFRPHLRRVEVIPFGQPDGLVLTCIHPDGLFEGVVPNERREEFDYRLRLVWQDESSSEADDAYRYGPVLTDFDLHLLAEGTHYRIYERLGARAITHGIRAGVHFAVWAPNAQRVSVVGDFNGWDGRVHQMIKGLAHGREVRGSFAHGVGDARRPGRAAPARVRPVARRRPWPAP